MQHDQQSYLSEGAQSATKMWTLDQLEVFPDLFMDQLSFKLLCDIFVKFILLAHGLIALITRQKYEAFLIEKSLESFYIKHYISENGTSVCVFSSCIKDFL